MTLFPNLTNAELDIIYYYAYQDARDKLGADTMKYLAGNYDSCLNRKRETEALLKQQVLLQSSRKSFLDAKVGQVATGTGSSINNASVATPVTVKEENRKYVVANDQRAAYYNVEINTFGWYNIDILLKDLAGVRESELVVRLQGTYSKTMQVLLVIPAYKVMLQGGMLEDGTSYGFYETNGRLPLPQHVKAYIIALGEATEKDQLYIGTREFTTSLAQKIDVTIAPTDSAGLKTILTGLHFEQMNIQVTRDTSKTLREVEARLNTLNREMAYCECHFWHKGQYNEGVEQPDTVRVEWAQ